MKKLEKLNKQKKSYKNTHATLRDFSRSHMKQDVSGKVQPLKLKVLVHEAFENRQTEFRFTLINLGDC